MSIHKKNISRRSTLTLFTALTGITLVGCSKENEGDTSNVASDSGANSAVDSSNDTNAEDSSQEISAGPLDQIQILTEFGQRPEIEFEAPLEIDRFYSKVHALGSGEGFEPGEVMIIKSDLYFAQTGELAVSGWDLERVSLILLTPDAQTPEIYETLINLTVGTRFMSATIFDGEQLIQVGDVLAKQLPRAIGEAKELPATLPSYSLAADGAPILASAPSMDAPENLIAFSSIEGAGVEAKSGDTLVMHYSGWDWESAEQFDSSWDRGQPFVFKLGAGNVIEGWDQGLQGVTAGSQVVLAIPPALAYGSEPSPNHELAGKTLLFVTDVLAVIPQ